MRGLITRHPITVPTGNKTGNALRRTNILHLTCFGQHIRLDANQRFAVSAVATRLGCACCFVMLFLAVRAGVL